MREQSSLRTYADTRFASKGGKRALSAQHAPRQNHLLAALPLEDYERLLPDLQPVPLPLGWTVHLSGDAERYLYFITAGIVSRFHVTEKGESAGFALTGSEGVIGVASFLSGECTRSQAMVLSAGYAYRLGAELVKHEFKRASPLRHLLLRYTQSLIAQTGQIAVCNRHHSLEQQLCRWILSSLDRLSSNVLTMTHELIADMLGVRRGGVTDAAGKLQEAGLIQYSRGRIAVLDRSQLEARACECYGVLKREHAHLLRAENTVGNAGVYGSYRQYRTGAGW
jgi:CRP-like cAMP-binding protein